MRIGQELEELRSTSCGWIYFGDHLLETCFVDAAELTLWRFAVLWWDMG